MMLVWFLALKVIAIGYAAVASIRGRFALGVVAVVTLLYLTAARGLSLIPPYVNLPASELLGATWWLYPMSIASLSAAATIVAFKKADGERDATPTHEHLERAAMAFLGNTILDVSMLLLLGAGYLLGATTF